MTPERWKRVDELYHAAVSRPPADRSAFLEQACAADGALRREVESLLNEPVSDAAFLEQPALVLTADLASSMIPAAMPGRSLGGYHLEALLGAGGMGEVYRARDAKLGRHVAIKILPPEFTHNLDRLARFEREARMLGALNHPNICAIYGFQEAEGLPFLILELVEGETLADVLREQPGSAGLPLPRALTFARQIVDALEVAHERGIVHRDLKPANIKVTPGGVVKVLDFGLAKIVRGESSTPGLTAAPAAGQGGMGRGAMMGTAAYMSPEQARGLDVDKRTDLWAFGCVLYEMLTGRLTFAGDTVSDSIAKILEREPDWSVLPATTPASIRRLLLRCLTKDPKKRLRDIGDARIEIDAVDEALPGSLPARVAPVRSGLQLLLWVAPLALAVGIGVWQLRGPAGAPDDPFAKATFSPLTDWEGTEAGAEISPDGRFVVFASDQAGEFDLWLRQIGTDRFLNLTRDIPPLHAPGIILRSFGFTGDGSEIWFSAGGDPGAAKMLIPLTGGTPRPFLTAGKATPAWSPDDTRIVFEEIKVGSGDPLFIADRTGANARQIFVHPDTTQHNHNPAWSPDGEWIYFVQGPETSADMDIWRIRPSGESVERMTRQNIAVNFLATLDARTLVYVARDKDRSGPWLWALDVERKETRRLVSGLEQFTSVAASRDGRRLVATVANSVAGMWRVPMLNRVALEADAEPYPMPTARALAPRFAGPALFYLSARGAGDGLWRFQNGAASEVRLGADAALSEPPAVSPDGARVAVVIRRDGKRLLAMMSSDGTDSQTLAAAIDIQGAAGQGAADWSPDGKWIVFGGRDAQGPALFKISVDDGRPVRLRDGEFVNPVWSPNDELIVYAGPFAAGQVTLYGVRPDGTPVDFPDLHVRPGGYRFSPDGAALVYLPTITSLDFWRLDLPTKARRQLTRLSDRGKLHTFDISPDGKHIVFDRSRDDSNIVLIELPK